MNFSANISLMFREYPFPDRFQAAANQGFRAVEIQFPYDESLEALKAASIRAGVEIVLINSPALKEHPFGIAGRPELQGQFRAGLQKARDYAVGLGVPRINILAGICSSAQERQACLATYRENIFEAAKFLSRDNIGVNIELINTEDIPGYLISHPDDVLNILQESRQDIGFQFDIYHLTKMGFDPKPSYRSMAPYIRHIQFADAPGRHEPGSGNIDFEGIFKLIEESGYTGWTGAEYHPEGNTEAGLGWLARWPGA